MNVTFAAGQREFNDEPGRDDATFYYVKGGILKQYNSLGKTAIYGEYGQFDDVLVGDAIGGMGNVISGSEAQVFGFGIVQHIDAAEMQLYVGYRHYEVDLDVVDGAGNAVAAPGLEDFYTIMAGARIDF